MLLMLVNVRSVRPLVVVGLLWFRTRWCVREIRKVRRENRTIKLYSLLYIDLYLVSLIDRWRTDSIANVLNNSLEYVPYLVHLESVYSQRSTATVFENRKISNVSIEYQRHHHHIFQHLIETLVDRLCYAHKDEASNSGACPLDW